MMSAKHSRMALLILLLSVALAAPGCGKKGPPLPPDEEKSLTVAPPASPAPDEKPPAVKPAEPAPSATPY